MGERTPAAAEPAPSPAARPPARRPAPGAGNAVLARVLDDPAARRVLARDPNDFKGSSYARDGPPGSALENRKLKLGGGAATTQEVDNACADATVKIAGSIAKLYAVATKLEAKSKEGWRIGPDKDTIALANDVKGGAKALGDIKSGIETLKKKNFDFSQTEFAKEPETPNALSMLKASVDSLAQAPETEAALQAIEANPNQANAKAWATSIGKQFSAAKNIVNALPFPPGCKFMQDYFAGMMGAPEAYISAVSAIIDARYGALDDEFGTGSGTEQQLREPGRKDGEIVWKGDAVPTVQASYFVAPGDKLYRWIIAHPELGGNNLYKLPRIVVIHVLMVHVQQDESLPEEDRKRWVAWLGAQI